MHQSIFSPIASNLLASGSTYRTKRKVSSEDSDSEQEISIEPRRIRSPPLKRRATFPVPELMTDHSASNSDEDVNMDTDMDMDEGENRRGLDSPMNEVEAMEFCFGQSGSGGFGFGPGMEEDEMSESLTQKAYPSVIPYPSIQATSNLGHQPSQTPFNIFSQYQSLTPTNSNLTTTTRPTSPLSAQSFSRTLAPPSARLLQPTAAAPLQNGASEIEKARAAHGPQCKSIPKLVMSQYGNERGEKSMWSLCGDCGAMERAA